MDRLLADARNAPMTAWSRTLCGRRQRPTGAYPVIGVSGVVDQ
jgi:hypothetical protein